MKKNRSKGQSPWAEKKNLNELPASLELKGEIKSKGGGGGGKKKRGRRLPTFRRRKM